MKKAMNYRVNRTGCGIFSRTLLEKGYLVYGTYRRTAPLNFWRIRKLGIEKIILNLVLLE